MGNFQPWVLVFALLWVERNVEFPVEASSSSVIFNQGQSDKSKNCRGLFQKGVSSTPLPPLLMDLWISSEIAQFRQGYLCRYGHIASKKGGREGGEPCMKSHVDGKDCHKIKSSVMLFSETTCQRKKSQCHKYKN